MISGKPYSSHALAAWITFTLMVCAMPGFSQEEKQIKSSDSSLIVIGKVNISGNHVTREMIIRRELLFSENDTLLADELWPLLQQSNNNLVNTSLFNFVEMDTVKNGLSPVTDIHVSLTERWYIWPFPIFEIADRNFNAWWEKKDLSRLNYGAFITWNNFRGRKEKLILYSRFGFDEKYYFQYQIPYINRKQTLGMGFSAGFSQNHEVSYNSENNKEVYYKGVTHYPYRNVFSYAEIFMRKNIHNTHWFKLSYNSARFSDSLLILNPDYSFANRNLNEYLAFYYQYKSDYRDYRHYPLHGHYFDVELDQTGLGIISSGNSLLIKTNLRKYWQLGPRFYFASGFTGEIGPFWPQPYYYMNGLGYGRDFVRGYEYYVVDGRHWALLKNNLKFAVIPRVVKNIPFIPTEKFSKIHLALYMNLYTDFAWVADERDDVSNPMANNLLMGSGVGFDLVTYYDLVFRFEFSVNKKWEKGVYIHFMAPI
ncbi:MAG: hypothetical protein JXA03_06740 [Bacteroidales bacterium]|nr:hypothetical protein [Bacteroidales bacterium]